MARALKNAPRTPYKHLFKVMARLILILVLVSIPHLAHALAGFSLNIKSINTAGWNLQGVKLLLAGSDQAAQNIALTIDQLNLPKPFNDLKLVDIRCNAFSWRNGELLCQEGRAGVASPRWHSPSTRFFLRIKKNHGSLKLTDLRLAGGITTITGDQQGGQWRVQIHAQGINSQLLHTLLQPESIELTGGRVNVNANITGSNAQINDVDLSADGHDLTGQTKDGRFATEKLALTTQLKARNLNGVWRWQNQIQLKAGAVYAEPVYLDTNGQDISLKTEGDWNIAQKSMTLSSLRYQHARTAVLKGNAVIQYRNGLKIAKAGLSLRSDDLEQFSAVYLSPLFAQTALEGLSAEGRLNAELSISGNALSALTATVNKLAIHDTAGRINLEDGEGVVYWSDNEAFNTPSHINWRELKLGPLPVGPSSLAVLARANTIRMLKKTTLPFLGGAIVIDQFGWQAKKQEEPDVYFAGSLNNVSLEQLSLALNWTPLSGTISGTIPKVEYRNKTLDLDGEININAFDGSVRITNLAASGLFTGFPKLYGDIDIDRLDLDQLTRKFKFGGMTGKLSGFVRQLYLENWHPVTFFAWLGTPDNDNSKHRISQKAVRNIASIGGGAAADLLSRSFLSIFETFGYDKIGLGCYLHDGVCQLSGVEAAPQGYVIIKGGGLPRIDVIGYNPRVDWAVLMERLSRISTTDEVIVK